MKKKPPAFLKHRATPYVMSALAGLLLSYLIVAFVVLPPDSGAEANPVPDVVGSSYDEAVLILDKAGFEAMRGPVTPTKAAAPRTVVKQEPSAGTPYPSGAKVLLHMSTAK